MDARMKYYENNVIWLLLNFSDISGCKDNAWKKLLEIGVCKLISSLSSVKTGKEKQANTLLLLFLVLIAMEGNIRDFWKHILGPVKNTES